MTYAEIWMLQREMQIPICQDTGMAVVFVEVGQDVHFIGGDFEQAIHEGSKTRLCGRFASFICGG